MTEHVVPTARQCLAAALAALPGMGPRRLRALLGVMSPERAWDAMRGIDALPAHLVDRFERAGVLASWRAHATDELIADVRRRVAMNAMRVVVLAHGGDSGGGGDDRIDDVRNYDGYPPVLAADPEAPAVLFVRGSLDVLRHRRVAIVGTRAATASGRRFARELGRDLAQHGVAVVSGLARGIDVAAHRGALDAHDDAAGDVDVDDRERVGPVGVVASGLDRPYPREHVDAWHDVARRGVLICESPPGTSADAFRFPLRNRIIAALSEILVVVESRATGGSMLTVDHALRRGIPVMAVPGSPGQATSEGTNALLAEGCAPVRDARDVLEVLGLDHRRHLARDARPRPDPHDRVVLDALAVSPLSLGEIVARIQRPVHDVAVSLGRLSAHGWVVEHAGWWESVHVTPTFDRVGR
jgi:DNA processing protein